MFMKIGKTLFMFLEREWKTWEWEKSRVRERKNCKIIYEKAKCECSYFTNVLFPMRGLDAQSTESKKRVI